MQLASEAKLVPVDVCLYIVQYDHYLPSKKLKYAIRSNNNAMIDFVHRTCDSYSVVAFSDVICTNITRVTFTHVMTTFHVLVGLCDDPEYMLCTTLRLRLIDICDELISKYAISLQVIRRVITQIMDEVIPVYSEKPRLLETTVPADKRALEWMLHYFEDDEEQIIMWIEEALPHKLDAADVLLSFCKSKKFLRERHPGKDAQLGFWIWLLNTQEIVAPSLKESKLAEMMSVPLNAAGAAFWYSNGTINFFFLYFAPDRIDSTFELIYLRLLDASERHIEEFFSGFKDDLLKLLEAICVKGHISFFEFVVSYSVEARYLLLKHFGDLMNQILAHCSSVHHYRLATRLISDPHLTPSPNLAPYIKHTQAALTLHQDRITDGALETTSCNIWEALDFRILLQKLEKQTHADTA